MTSYGWDYVWHVLAGFTCYWHIDPPPRGKVMNLPDATFTQPMHANMNVMLLGFGTYYMIATGCIF